MKLHYADRGAPRCGLNGEVTDKKSLVTCQTCRKAMKKRHDYRAQADDLFSRQIRARDERCLNCGTTERLQCAHIFPRTYGAVRTDERNAVALCVGCHKFFTHRPLEWEEWVEERFPNLLAELRPIALRGQVPDWKTEVERLSNSL